MTKFITIEEAKTLTGKSDKTLRRVISQLASQPSTQSLVKKDEKGRWLVLSSYFHQESDQSNDQANDQAVSRQRTSNELSIFQDKVLDIMKAQLEEKDRQIEQLNERLREAHVLNRDLQHRLLPGPTAERPEEVRETAEPQKEEAPLVVQEPKKPEEPPKKRSLWKIVLRALSQ